MKRYHYGTLSPLKSGTIRLLKLHPGQEQTDLEANLVVYRIQPGRGSTESEQTLQDTEPYDALSYTWGPKSDQNIFIKIIARDEAYSIPIRPSLNDGLRQLRDSKCHKFLWVDALCMNQEDEDEKSFQIPLMNLIYNRAERVHVWLGTEADDSARALKFIRECLDPDDFDRLVKDSFASRDWAALSALIRRPWFSRRWIVQEIALAKHAILHCGKDSVSWREFADVVSMLSSKQHELRDLFRESNAHHNHPDYLGDLSVLGATQLVEAADNFVRKHEDGQIIEKLYSLEALMSSMLHFEASEPRDILYAVLWLANDAHPVTRNAYHYRDDARSSFSTSLTSSLATNRALPNLSIQARPRSHIEAFPDFDPHTSELGTSSNRYPLVKRQKAGSYHETSPTLVSHRERVTLSSVQYVASPMSTFSDVQASTGAEPQRSLELTGSPLASWSELFSNTDVSRSSLTRSALPRPHLSITDGLPRKDRERIAGSFFLERLEYSRITVDYRKSVFEVCKDFLEFVIRRSSSLDMICRPWAPNDPDLPSWIPQLAGSPFGLGAKGVYRRLNADPLVGQPGVGSKSYKASKGLPAKWTPKDRDWKCLIVHGFVLDIVAEKKSPATAGVIPSDWLEAVGWQQATDMPPDTFWRTLVGNRDSHGQRPHLHWRRRCQDAFNTRPPGGDLNTSEAIMYDCPSTVREFLERVQCMVWSRRLVLLKRLQLPKSLGLAPAKVKKGDLICILNGCSVPVLLRKFVDGKPAARQPICLHAMCPGNAPRTNGSVADAAVHYKFIGECYVHGMMDGESFDRKLPEQDFALR